MKSDDDYGFVLSKEMVVVNSATIALLNEKLVNDSDNSISYFYIAW